MNQRPIIFLAYANDKTESGVFLRNLSTEMHGIRKALTEAVNNGLCELVERSSATIADIVDVFQNPAYQSRIAIFHYAGHAGGEGLLLETLDGEHSLAHREGLVDILARQEGLKLVFLNGCSSEEQTNALMEAGVSAVIGTTDSINDNTATQLSIRFYAGMGLGNGIEKSWNDVISELKITHGSDHSRAISYAGKKEKTNALPWVIQFRKGSEIVKKWNLPDAAGNPLFGLPEPLSIHIPESPFVYLNPFEASHTEVFFGRSKYIRDIYFLITDKDAPYLTLLYGQSGVGKTSLLKAGLIPRLEEKYKILYLKRNDEIGLSNTMFNALLLVCGFSVEDVSLTGLLNSKEDSILTTLESIAMNIDEEIQPELHQLIDKIKAKQHTVQPEETNKQAPSSLLDLWLLAEEIHKKPLLLLFDQIEEAYTRPNDKHANEMVTLLANIKQVYNNSQHQPQGKILLSYRKEFQSEIEEECASIEISRSRVFLDHFKKEDILEIFKRLAENPRLKSRYNLTIDEQLPELIASDYTRTNNESPVGPVFQIMLTKMWHKAQALNPGSPIFSLELYAALREEGMAMEEFLMTQLELVSKTVPEAFESGLALDLLKFHCTRTNTSGLKTEAEILEVYPNAHDVIKRTLSACVDEFLLLEASGQRKATTLTHDLLALVVDKYYQSSMRPVQQANRILNSRMEAIHSGSQVTLLDEYDLHIIQLASPYMRVLSPEENRLLDESNKEQDRKLHQQKRRKRIRQFIVSISIIVFVVICGLSISLQIQEKAALLNQKAAASSLELKSDYTLALYLAVEGLELGGIENNYNGLKEALTNSFYTGLVSNAARYKVLVKSNNAILNILYNGANQLFIPLPQDSTANIYDFEGEVLATLRPNKVDGKQKSFCILQKAEFGFGKKTIIGLGTDSILRIWDLKGDLLFESNFPNKVKTFSCSKVKNEIACATGNVIMVINYNGSIVETHPTTTDVKSVLFSPNGKQILVLFQNQPTRLIYIGTHQTIKLANQFSIMNDAQFAHHGNFILTCQNDSFITLWNTQGKLVHVFPAMPAKIRSFEFHPSDSLFSVSSGKDLIFFSTYSYSQSTAMVKFQHADFITKTVFSGSGTKVLTCSSDKNATSTDYQGEVIMLKGHQIDVTCGFYSIDEKLVFTGSLDGTVRSWDLNIIRPPQYPGHSGPAKYLKMTPDGKYIISMGVDSMILVRHAKDPNNITVSKLKYSEGITDPDYSIDGKYILCRTSSNQVFSWDWTSDAAPMVLNNKSSQVIKAVYWGEDSVATISSDGKLKLFSSSGDLFKTFNLGDSNLTYLQYSYGGKTLAIGNGNGIIYLYDPYTYEIDSLVGHKPNLAITSFNFSNNGEQLVSISDDNTAIVWDLQHKTHVVLDKAIFAPYYKLKINSARISPDGDMVVTSYTDRTARLWSINGTLIATLMGHTDNVFDAGFTRSNRKIYTVSDDKTMRWWDADGDYVNWFIFGGGQKINQIEIDLNTDLIYAAVDDGSVEVRMTAGGIYENIIKTDSYKYFKAHRDRYREEVNLDH